MLRVFFYGSYIPLQGVDVIVRAARVLESRGDAVRLTLVGSGQTLPAARALAERLGLGVSTVRFEPPVPYDALPGLMAASDLCLGVFGATPKAGRVVPNKVFDALACARPVITADTAAARDAIRALLRDPALRSEIARAGHESFRARFSLRALSDDLAALVGELVNSDRQRA
jgi:glycosyltransferase involved in cell wall biosynthesis